MSETAEVKVTTHTAFRPLDVSSTDTVPTLGMFSKAVKSSHAEAAALISVEKYSPWQNLRWMLGWRSFWSEEQRLVAVETAIPAMHFVNRIDKSTLTSMQVKRKGLTRL